MRSKYTFIIFSLSIVQLLFAVAGGYNVFLIINHTENDAQIINTAGIIRGSIQRLTKLTISKHYSSFNDISSTINRLMDKKLPDKSFVFWETGIGINIKEQKKRLRKNWKSLSKLLSYPKSEQSKKWINKVINESEKSWKLADDIVLSYQCQNEYEYFHFKVLYMVLVVIILVIIAMLVMIFILNKKNFEYLATHDSMTDLYNRNLFNSLLSNEIVRSKRYQQPISLILFDIDSLKRTNDTLGHFLGDKMIKNITSIVKLNIRKSDLTFRLGGDEFGIIMPVTKSDDAFRTLEKIRVLIADFYKKTTNKNSISIGIAEYSYDDTVDSFYKKADSSLYAAKNKGKNISVIWNSSL